MVALNLSSETDFEAWRSTALQACRQGLTPSEISWGIADRQHGLFDSDCAPGHGIDNTAKPLDTEALSGFFSMAERVICHRDPERFAKLYGLLWRLLRSPRLLENSVDLEVCWLRQCLKAVNRDCHKMHAFVRFRKLGESGTREQFAAWFEPTHRITALATPFFVRRFPNMDWAIMTPDSCAVWDGHELTFKPGACRKDVPSEDAVENEWRTYFASIFNPARLKVNAMTAEMPRKYWHNLPEASLIKGLVADARNQSAAMESGPTTEPSAMSQSILARRSARRETCHENQTSGLAEINLTISRCDRCSLHACATQPVFGEGPGGARIMLVGEQPGDREDLTGRPFVGPAGEVLDRALHDAGIERASCYLTNAVKHFKFRPSGRRRLHARPNAGEIQACRWWLDREIEAVGPELIIALGTTAAFSLTGQKTKLSEVRGRSISMLRGHRGLITVHPAYILRLPEEARRKTAYDHMVADLRKGLSMAGV